MKHVIDDTGAAAAIIRLHLPRDRHLQLIRETHEMLEAGASIEDIVWIISPSAAIADRRQEAIQHAEGYAPEVGDLLRSLPDRVPGEMLVLYAGPEGLICQRWQSILTLPAVQAAALQRAERNDPCPCGSGRKYKRCCGAIN